MSQVTKCDNTSCSVYGHMIGDWYHVESIRPGITPKWDFCSPECVAVQFTRMSAEAAS